ncbi:MAG: elongation factor G [Planctomycetes bacterium]|nr:elongation factor G [Planctomycetota bacterium]
MNKIHNIAVAGHGTCGKTTLVEELLFRAKSISRHGSVDDGTSALDFDPEARERHFSIDLNTGYLEKDGHAVNLIDTPGYPDFIGTAIDAFSAVETALIAVDSVQGIRLNTRRVWDEAGKQGLARILIITRLDAENADYDGVLAQIQDVFGRKCVPMFIPDASGPDISKVENTYVITPESSSRAKELHDQLVEAVVEVNERMMEKYLAEEQITQEEIDAVFAEALLKGAVVPVLAVSVRKNVGLNKTLDTLLHIAPNHDAPLRRRMRTAEGTSVEVSPAGGPNDPLLARVFKIVSDPFVGKLSYLRIFSGTMTPNMPIQDVSVHAKERTTTILRMQGKESVILDKAGPGELIAIPKLDSLHIGDTLGDLSRHEVLEPIAHPIPMVKLAIEPKNRKDETKITEALKKLAETDSTLSVERNRQTHELVLAGRSTLHLDVALRRLKRRYELEVETRIPKTSYLESIVGKSEAQYKHKKQTGGRGQYGEVYIRIEPFSANGGDPLEFEDAVVGGSIPNQYIPAVEKGIREIMEQGILAGCPVIGCKVTLYDGSFHAVDSSENAFKTAAREAFRKAFLAARPVLLEPIVNIEIRVPMKYMGDVTGDLNSRRGRITGMDSEGEDQIVRAYVPEAEIKSYSTQLRSMTHGEGSYAVEFLKYEVVPGNVQQQVVEQLRKERTIHDAGEE